ncbi:MAG: tetratricopeptide repeat protein [Candidatus Riflebacteria bacterium]
MKKLISGVFLLLFLGFPAYSLTFDALPNYQDEGMKLYIRGTGRIQEKNYAEAITDLRQAVRLRPDLPEAFHNLGFALERTGDLKTAARAYEKAISLKPNYPSALNNLGFLLATTETDPAKAVMLCQRAVELQPNSASFRDSLGWALYKSGRGSEAISHFQAAIKIDPTFFKSYFNIGLIELTQSNFQAAAEMFKNVIRLRRDYLKAYVSLGDCYEKLNDNSKALYVYRQAISLSPDSQPIKKHLEKKVKSLSSESKNYYFSNVKQMQGSSKLQEFMNRKNKNSMSAKLAPAFNPIESSGSFTPVSAIAEPSPMSQPFPAPVRAISRPAASLADNSADTWSSSYSAASVYPVQSDQTQLSVEQERELERKYSLSKSYMDRGLVAEAEKELRRIISIAPDGSTVNRQARNLLLKVKKMIEEKTDERAATHIDMGKDFFRSGQYEMAKNEFNKALQLDPENSEVHKDMALLHYNLGNLKEAYEASKRAIALDRTKKEAYVVLGSLYAQKGRKDDALRTLKMVREVSNGTDAVDELADKMIAELSSEY